MKIIDLLNKIANGEEDDLQTEFEFDGKIWNFCQLNHSEYCLDELLLNQNITITKHKEVLEEEKKIPEKLPYYSMEKIQKAKNKDEWREERITLLEKRVEDLHIKMNDLLDYLKSKGE